MSIQTTHNYESINKLGTNMNVYIEVAKSFSAMIEGVKKNGDKVAKEAEVEAFFTELFNKLSDKKVVYITMASMYFDNLYPKLASYKKVFERAKQAFSNEKELHEDLMEEKKLIDKKIFLYRKGNGFLAVQEGIEDKDLKPAHKRGRLEKEYKLKKLAAKQNKEIHYFDAHLKYDLVEIVPPETIKVSRTFQKVDSYDTARVYEIHISPDVIYPDGSIVRGEIKGKLIESSC